MNYAIQFHPAAEAEVNEAAAFYEDASSGLGEDFLAEAEHTLIQIGANPLATPVIARTCAEGCCESIPIRFSKRFTASRSGFWPSCITDDAHSIGESEIN